MARSIPVRSRRTLAVGAVAAVLAGCATARTEAVGAGQGPRIYRRATVVAEPPAKDVEVPRGKSDAFQRRLVDELRTRGFREGPGLTVRWRFTEFSVGGQAVFFLTKSEDWRDTLSVQVRFLDEGGKELASTVTECKGKDRALDVSTDELLRECAASVATFARTRFRPRAPRRVRRRAPARGAGP